MVDDGFSDDIWDQTDDVHNQEWNKMAEEFTNVNKEFLFNLDQILNYVRRVIARE